MKSSAQRVVGIVLSMMLGLVIQSRAQERTAFIAEGRIGNAVIQSNVWQAGDFEYDLSTNTAAPAVRGHYPWPNGETVPFEVRYDAVSGQAQMQVGWGTNLVWTVPGEPLTSNGVVNIRLGGRGGNVAGNEDEYGLRLTDLQWETNGVVAVALTNTFVAVAGGGYQTGLISGLPAAAQWRLWGQVRMTWPDGTLPAHSQLAFQLAFTEWRVNVRGDTDRDGQVGEADEAGKAEWTIGRGAFVPVNQWVATDADLERLPAVNVWELAPVVLGPVGAVPEGWTVRVRMSGLARMRLVSADKATRIGPGPAVFTTNANWLATGVQLYGATEYERVGRANHDRQRVIVELLDGEGKAVARDEAVWEIAPVVLAWNSLPLDSLYCSDQFPNAVAGSKQARKPGGGQWVQDYMELASAWWRSDTVLNQVVNLEHSAAGRNFIDGLLMAEGEAPTLLPWHKTTWDNVGNGGNIEVFPPYTESAGKHHPLGRVVLGTQHKDALPQIQAQGLQNPIELKKLDWLYVGHVDEVFSFLSDSEVLVADPELAWREILKMMIDPAVTEKTIRVGNAPYDVGSMTTVTNPVNYFVVQALPLTYVLGLSAPQLVVSNGTYVVGDRLLIDKEVMSVTSITTSTNGLPPGVTNLTLFVDRSQYYGSVQQQHFPGALIRRLNPDILANVYPYASQSNLVSRLEAVKKELQIELGKNLTFKPVPVLFRRLPDPRTGEPLYTATTANMVNSVFDPFPAPGRIYSASPGNARFETLFSGAAGRPVVFTRDEDDRLAWDNYHVWVGSLHCGSNGKRVPPTKLSPPAKVWWEYQEFEHWGK